MTSRTSYIMNICIMLGTLEKTTSGRDRMTEGRMPGYTSHVLHVYTSYAIALIQGDSKVAQNL